MNSKKPNIGVTGPDKGGRAAWWFSWFAIVIHGGNPIRIRPGEGIPEADIHGLVIGGGADINPERYGVYEIGDLFAEDQEVTGLREFVIRIMTVVFFPFIYLIRTLFSTSPDGIDNKRDELEFTLLEQAVEKGIPVLGICRGAQLLNIYFGGTLYRDIDNYYTEIPRVNSVWPKKKISIDENSLLFEILDFRHVWVNAMHHQAVDELGEELKVAAREENGIVQAIEHSQKDFVVGVQWHPEYMPQIPPQRRIFEAVVEKAKAYLEK